MKHKVIFIHGFDSSPETNKYTVISFDPKACVFTDYSAETFSSIDKKYHELIETAIAEGFAPIIVGHSLGGYWANRMADRFNLGCVLLNPQLWPHSDKIRDVDLYINDEVERAPKYVYIETGDEVIDVQKTIDWAEYNSELTIYHGGHHRVKRLQVINTLIKKAILNELVG